MARVSIEERAAAGAKKLARIMGWSIYEALGRLYVLWHDSQELEQSECSLGDISTWLDLNADQEQEIIAALADSGFIRIIGPDRYEIVGNSKHIENLVQKREAARENGKLGGRPVKVVPRDNQKETNVGYLQKPTSETQPNQHDNHSSLQFSAVLCNTEIQKQEEGGIVSKKPETTAFVLDDESLNSIFQEKEILERQWNAWRKAYPDPDWVAQEIKRAYAWEISSPANRKKKFATFITRWLGRGWDTRQRKPDAPNFAHTGGEQRVKCAECASGIIRAKNRSSGVSELCACSCAAGRTKTSYVRFDEQKFERAS